MSKNTNKKTMFVIIGTTASGKTKFGVKLAYKLNGEIISADSRQVYIGMDIGTGKDLKDYKYKNKTIPYHLIDIVVPNENFDLAKWNKLALESIKEIISRGKTPIIVGGTGLYVQSLVDGYKISNIGPDLKLRKFLEEKSKNELHNIIKENNKKFFEKLNESEKGNKRRLVRYIELLKNSEVKNSKENNSNYDFKLIGITFPRELLKKKIYNRLIERIEKEDLIREVENLNEKGISWKRLESFGLEYKYISLYLQDKLDYDEMVNELYTKICQFSKRQMTWFRRWEKQGADIQWLNNQKDINLYFKNMEKNLDRS